MKLKLVDTICAKRDQPSSHCRECRANPRFRWSLAEAFELPPGGIELCPFGVGTPAHAPAAPPPTITGLAQLARDYDGDAAAESERLDTLIKRMAGRPAAQLAAYRKARPDDLTSRIAYRRWMHGAINATANQSRGLEQIPYHVAALQHGWVIVPDRIVVLSLDSRPDRWAAFNESCKKSKYLSRWKIERYRARPPNEMIVPDWWGVRCSQGDTHYATRMDHLEMWSWSYGQGHEHVLIFEDDAIIQDCFDDAYELACAGLPKDWLGLWLTSDGHKKIPVPVAPGLVRCTDQTNLHAYLLNRRGMHRVWHHVAHNRSQIIDGATEDLHGIEPNFYATQQNAVRQFGCRYEGVRTQFHDAINA